MTEAREVMDRLTEALLNRRDIKAVEACYADTAVALTPDAGELSGSEEISEWLRQFVDAFPDARYESIRKHDAGDTAIDEGTFVGTNTGPLSLPSGVTLPATGMQVRTRTCDIATVQDGAIVQHNFYYDQMDFLSQLGLQPDA